MLSRPLKAHFLAAIRKMLRPVVRQLISYGVSYPAIDQALKELYVDVAEHEFALPFKRQTDSRLALMTGIHRKEIASLRRRRQTWQEPVEVEDTPVTHIIGRWMAGAPYATDRGDPRPLPYEAGDPAVSSFSRLVKEVGVDVPVRSVLDELIRIDAVELQPNGNVVLRREAHIPVTGLEGKMTVLGTDPGELFSTIVHNIEHEDALRLQRKAAYDNIGGQALGAVREQARQIGEEFVRHANSLLASYDRDRNPQGPGGERSRVVMGVYYFEEPVARSGEPRSIPEEARPPGRIRRPR